MPGSVEQTTQKKSATKYKNWYRSTIASFQLPFWTFSYRLITHPLPSILPLDIILDRLSFAIATLFTPHSQLMYFCWLSNQVSVALLRTKGKYRALSPSALNPILPSPFPSTSFTGQDL
jgi:hypothetical protein